MEIDLRRYRRTVAAFLVLILLYLIPLLPSLYGDYLWFVSLGYDGVFTKVILYKLGIFGVVSGVSFGVLYATYRVTVRNIRRVEEYEPSALVPAVLALVSLVLGLLYASSWRTVMEYLNGVDFGKVDPVYSLDVSFYVFELPFFNLVVGYLILVTVLSALVALALYTLTFGFEEYDDVIGDLEGTTVELEPEALVRRVSENGYGQMTVYIGVLLVLFGVNFYLSRYGLVFSTRGAVFGLGRTDFAVFKPLLSFLAVVSVGGGVACVANVSFRDNRVVYTAVGAVLIFAVVGNVAGIVYQSYVVEPDEYNKEKRFIENEIEFTRSAYALGVINETEFSVSRNLTRREIRSNPGTMNNIRLWDYRPLKTTYNQQQSLRTYYTFNDVDTDRYTIDGNETQVMLSAREVDVDQLSSGARSWVNTHLVYTHGFGVAMSPVSEVTSEGLPKYYIKDIPPKSSVDIEIEQPRIYYGESTDNYVISNSETKEFDYPSNDTNVYSSYSGAGGVELSSALREVVYSVKFGAPQILLSGSVNSDSRIQFNRDIKERVRRIAPFLEYDEDPYIAVADGRLKWIIDAYTTTSNYPYSKHTLFRGKRVNYVRNSVKVVIDAYSGEVNFYVSDEGPIIRTY
ncbi:MAG: UPF0182 family protein, partial [Halobacteria archaeon]|nr:UPF0182 family protein [Halobacteria archaeon]